MKLIGIFENIWKLDRLQSLILRVLHDVFQKSWGDFLTFCAHGVPKWQCSRWSNYHHMTLTQESCSMSILLKPVQRKHGHQTKVWQSYSKTKRNKCAVITKIDTHWGSRINDILWALLSGDPTDKPAEKRKPIHGVDRYLCYRSSTSGVLHTARQIV